MPFAGLRVLSLESRRASEIELLISKQDGKAFVAPSVKERPLDDHADAFRLLEQMEGQSFDLLILMTGVGLAFWRDVIVSRYDLSRVTEALRKVTVLARGPKPSAVLRAMGLTPDITIPEPNTWREIVEALEKRTERRFAIQEYGRPNPEFVEALEKLGATVETFALYRWELPDDIAPLREAVQRLKNREVDVAMFTSSVQLDHLLAVADKTGDRDDVLAALKRDVVVASIGPIMTTALTEQGIRPDVEPSSPKMGPLVYAAAEESQRLLTAKRSQN